MDENEICDAFLMASPWMERYKYWNERTIWEKLMFWTSPIIRFRISEEIIDLTIKHPRWFIEVLKED